MHPSRILVYASKLPLVLAQTYATLSLMMWLLSWQLNCLKACVAGMTRVNGRGLFRN